MELTRLIYTVNNGIAELQLNYPKNLNAFDEIMADEVIFALDKAETDNDVKVIVIKGSERAFSAGGDVGYFYDIINSGGDINLDNLFSKVQRITIKMKKSTKMIITSVGGVSAGAGVSVALAGDFVLCSDKASFILAFVKLGLVPDAGITYLLAKAIGANKALDLAATGRVMTAGEANDLGLIYKLTTAEELEKATVELANKLANGPLLAYKNIKKQIYAASFSDYERWLSEVEITTAKECLATEDFKEGVKAFMEKRPANFLGK